MFGVGTVPLEESGMYGRRLVAISSQETINIRDFRLEVVNIPKRRLYIV